MANQKHLYAGDDPEEALGLLATAEHGHLTAWDGATAQPELAFMHYAFDSAAGKITGHLANGNPLLDLLARLEAKGLKPASPAVRKLARKLGVVVGDSVWIEVLEGRRPRGEVPVSAVFQTTIAMPAYMELDALNQVERIE